MEASQWTLQWSHGLAHLTAQGGMLGPVYFQLESNAGGSPLVVQPFSQFPWGAINDPNTGQALPALLAQGRGEWPCVPFGLCPDPQHLGWHHPPHGEAAHSLWHYDAEHSDAQRITLFFQCAPPSPISRIERRIAVVENSPALDCQLRITVREPCQLPIGLHPVLRLAHQPSGTRLECGRYAFAHSFFAAVEEGRDCLAPNQIVHDLAELVDLKGLPIDICQLPLAQDTESLVQLCQTDGHIALAHHSEGYRFHLHWDAAQLPSCLLWLSNRGRLGWPWCGEHVALGIEPICSYFDQGLSASIARNTIQERGVPTVSNLTPEHDWQVSYRMSVTPLS